jgi:hypothetical protein
MIPRSSFALYDNPLSSCPAKRIAGRKEGVSHA